MAYANVYVRTIYIYVDAISLFIDFPGKIFHHPFYADVPAYPIIIIIVIMDAHSLVGYDSTRKNFPMIFIFKEKK